MDDLFLNFSSIDEADARMQEIRSIFAVANMELHKMCWTGTPSENSKVLGMGTEYCD